MQPFVTVTGIAVPLLQNDVNTDQIAPVPTQRSLRPDYRELFFHRARRRPDDRLDPSHVLNQPQFAHPSILIAGRNFGCGSSREGAVWTMLAVGITCIIARQIADLYRENCLQNGLLPIELAPEIAEDFERRVVECDGRAPFTADLRTKVIRGPLGDDIAFDISDADRMRLLEGLDDIGMSLKHEQEIAEWETRARLAAPWLQRAVRSS